MDRVTTIAASAWMSQPGMVDDINCSSNISHWCNFLLEYALAHEVDRYEPDIFPLSSLINLFRNGTDSSLRGSWKATTCHMSRFTWVVA